MIKGALVTRKGKTVTMEQKAVYCRQAGLRKHGCVGGDLESVV